MNVRSDIHRKDQVMDHNRMDHNHRDEGGAHYCPDAEFARPEDVEPVAAAFVGGPFDGVRTTVTTCPVHGVPYELETVTPPGAPQSPTAAHRAAPVPSRLCLYRLRGVPGRVEIDEFYAEVDATGAALYDFRAFVSPLGTVLSPDGL